MTATPIIQRQTAGLVWMQIIGRGRNGRGEWIRTTGLLVPNQALYQAEPRPDERTVSPSTEDLRWYDG